jgi:hypothetical protein
LKLFVFSLRFAGDSRAEVISREIIPDAKDPLAVLDARAM